MQFNPMLSYAQNFEDVVLRRALHDIEQGFYLDLGAGHPTQDSVTKHFYNQGWKGINVEPNDHFFQLLQAERKKDINLPFAVSHQSGTVNFFKFEKTGLSTLSQDIADFHQTSGFQITTEDCETITLNEIFSAYVKEKVVDFLKIDVEGWEEAIIRSTHWQVYRPRIIIVESTFPNTSQPNYHAWEATLLDNSYKFVYFDGLNRFYIREEDKARIPQLAIPPHVFDNFKLHAQTHFAFPEKSMVPQKTLEIIATMEENESLKEMICWMESSKFWKLRSYWIQIKENVFKRSKR